MNFATDYRRKPLRSKMMASINQSASNSNNFECATVIRLLPFEDLLLLSNAIPRLNVQVWHSRTPNERWGCRVTYYGKTFEIRNLSELDDLLTILRFEDTI